MEKRRYLQFKNCRTGECAENPGKIDVTGKSEREIERLENGMLNRCDVEGGWYVDDFTESSPPQSTQE